MSIDKRIYKHEAGGGHFANGFIFGDYGWSIKKYRELADMAKKDFPKLKDSEIECNVVIDSTYMKHFAFVQFPLPSEITHKDYREYMRFPDWGAAH